MKVYMKFLNHGIPEFIKFAQFAQSEPLCYTTAVNSLRSVPERNYIPKPDLRQYSTLFHKTWNFLQKTFIFAVGSQNTGLLSGQTI